MSARRTSGLEHHQSQDPDDGQRGGVVDKSCEWIVQEAVEFGARRCVVRSQAGGELAAALGLLTSDPSEHERNGKQHQGAADPALIAEPAEMHQPHAEAQHDDRPSRDKHCTDAGKTEDQRDLGWVITAARHLKRAAGQDDPGHEQQDADDVAEQRDCV